MTPAEEERGERQRLGESMIRLEAKIDVVLSQHEGKIDDLVRRQGETTSTLREHDGRITANALTIAETRIAASSAQTEVQTLRADVASKSGRVPTWVAVGVAAVAIVLGPILTALIQRG
jgi:hypothetical protein